MTIKLTQEELRAIVAATEGKFSDQRSLASARKKLFAALTPGTSQPVLLKVAP